jgi:pimeloyl-ACP methyl ester carboxylesterase
MKNLRTYGKSPFAVAVIHGGPGAAGEMAAVAYEISRSQGVLEPLQTEQTVSGQITELRDMLVDQGDLPVILIGHSWGAQLSFIFTAKNPALVKKLLLVSSGVFDNTYAAGIMNTRLNRLSRKDKTAIKNLVARLDDPRSGDKNEIFGEFGKIINKADSFDPLSCECPQVEYRYDIYEKVWKEAQELRRGGDLVALGKHIPCPVVAIHGDYDPHPADGVRIPLLSVIKKFKFILLKKCGHRPWLERYARDKFYKIIEEELDRSGT